MGDFSLPSLPPDFIPNFLTQPNPINNDTNFPDVSDRLPFLNEADPTHEDRFPRDDDGEPSFLNELNDALNNLAQTNQDWSLSREQWIETAALYAQVGNGTGTPAGARGPPRTLSRPGPDPERAGFYPVGLPG